MDIIKRGLIFLLIFLLSILVVNAGTAEYIKPSNLQVFTVGDLIEFEISVDFDIKKASLGINCEDDFSYSYFEKKSFDEPGTKVFKTTFDTTGRNPGICTFNSVFYKFEGATDIANIITIALEDNNELPQGPVSVVRGLPDSAFPGSFVDVFLSVIPHESFTGIVVRETVPDNVFMSKYGAGNVEVIFDGVSLLKYLFMSANDVNNAVVFYTLKLPNDLPSGSELTFNGDWVILENEGEIIGDQTITIEGFKIPSCPINDIEL